MNCGGITQKLGVLKNINESFSIALATNKLDRVFDLQNELDGAIFETFHGSEQEKYRILHREMIAAKLGLDYVDEFSEGLAWGWNYGVTYLVDYQGKVLNILPAATGIYSFHNGAGWLYRESEGQYQLFFADGEPGPRFDFVDEQSMKDKVILVGRFNGSGVEMEYSYIYPDGTPYNNQIYEKATRFSEGLALTKKAGEDIELIDEKGLVRSVLKGEEMSHFSEGEAWIQLKENVFYTIKKNGQVGIWHFGSEVRPFKEGWALVRNLNHKGSNYTYVNHEGNYLPLNFTLAKAEGFSDGMAKVQVTSEQFGLEPGYRFIDLNGKPAIPRGLDHPVFTEATSFTDGLACVVTQSSRRWRYMDQAGFQAVPGEYNYAEAFVDGVAYVEFADGSSGYIDMAGKPVFTRKKRGRYGL